jgi:hypothetical protein
MSEDHILLKCIQHWCPGFETFNETQEKAQFHGNLDEYLLAVILATSIQNITHNLTRNYQYFYICSVLWNHHSETICSQTSV